MRRGAVVLLAVLLVGTAAGLVGCAAADRLADPLGRESTIRVTGTRTVIPLYDILRESYAGKAEFSFLPSVYSSGGVSGVAEGTADLGMVSRTLTEEEQQLGLKYYVISWDALAFAVHPSVTLTDITTEQLRDIYSGTVGNWAELGGPDLPITVFDRNEGGSTKVIVRRYVLGEELGISERAIPLAQESDMVDGIRSTKGAIGYVSFGWVTSRSVPLRILRLNGVEPSVANVLNGTYQLSRPLGFVTAENADKDVVGFVAWATGDEAARLIAGKGYAPAR